MFYSKKLYKLKKIKHCFFSRKKGFSKGIYKSLNCGKGSKDKHKNISDLRNPATWTSFNIIKRYSGKSEMLSQRDISLSLVRLGAEDWNKDLAPLIREYTGSNIIFFDEQMIGIHSKLLKKNARSVSRNLKREKVKFKAKDVIDIMATSVFFYIEEVFIKKRKDTN